MAVLMIGEVPNLTEEMYAGMIEGLKPQLQSTKGFISHAGGPSPNGGWRVVELWDTEDDGRAWFEATVKPNLPEGVVPDRRYFPVHSAFTAG
jgi:hypothetical protein